MRRAISYGRQTIDEDDIRSVVKALRSDFLTQGPLSEEFEDRLKRHTGAKYAVVCSNGTAALHLAILAAGIHRGERVITSPMTFLASSNSALYAGAIPVFADIDEETFNIDPAEIERKIRYNSPVRAIIPVHFAGHPCDMERISEVARENNLVVIEDACHALGASWKDRLGNLQRVGNCSHSDMTVFSFHPVKSITTGEGGAITTNDPVLYKKLKLLRSHGVTKNAAEFKAHDDAPWLYEMHELGFNYRLSDIQCALGISQIERLGSFIKRRNEIASLYGAMLLKYPFVRTPAVNEDRTSAFHIYPARIPFGDLGISKKEWFLMMKSIGIHPQVHYIPVHLQPYYRSMFGYNPGDFPRAEKFYSEEVSLPIYPTLTDEEAGAVVEAIVSTIACAAAASREAAGLKRILAAS
ncbi:MAG: UDP-4-amino-4,6-dideoxy-N-acetyl-beta-L-altrosamine transaminase [Deltaproteobacteria bacterium]|nr:UDP-4-amino-4,6-dideoxy-N-acetyl-beta-L-altrosamine transaminase [Deltaproteobacteria bacterium]